MKISNLQALCLMVLAAGCAASNADAQEKALTIGGKKLTMQAPPKCAQAQRPRRQLAKYLSQYDPAQDPREDIRDETPRTRAEIESTKRALVEDGFHYPNGQDSVITWMDFDGDGVCDFSASAGVGGMRSIDRMFVFRGLPNGQFKLADAYRNYMEGSSILLPYIPLTISGEKSTILAREDTLMQWQDERKQFATCETIAHGVTTGRQRPTPPLLTALCPHAQEIYTWAANQLPHQNQIPYSGAE